MRSLDQTLINGRNYCDDYRILKDINSFWEDTDRQAEQVAGYFVTSSIVNIHFVILEFCPYHSLFPLSSLCHFSFFFRLLKAWVPLIPLFCLK